MIFETFGNKQNPAILFFHAMGVTGASSEPVVRYLQDRYFCILPTSTVYCAGQKYRGKTDEVRQVEVFLRAQGVERLTLVVASSIGADLAQCVSGADRVIRGACVFRWRTVCADRQRNPPYHDALFVPCHQEPVLVQGRYPQKNPLV